MNLTLLSKKRTEELEQITVPIENLTGYQAPYISYLFRIQGWYRENGLDANTAQKHHFAKLTELFGHPPLYYKNYEYRNAVWGFEWENEEFVFYKSERGTSIQVLPKFRKSKLEQFLNELMHLLKAENAIEPYQKKAFEYSCPYCGDELSSASEIEAQHKYYKAHDVCSHWNDDNLDEF